jgi:hypothetical protein
MELKIGILYLGLHNQLKKTYGYNIITRKEFFGKIGKHFQTPKNLRPLILNEMIKKNLIKKIDRDNIEILNIDIDIDKPEGCHELYKMVGLI